MSHEQVLELVAARRLADLAAAAVPHLDDLAGRQHHLEADHQVAGVAVAPADQRPAVGPDPPAHQRARVRGRVVGIDEAVGPQLLGELQHVDPGLHGHRAVLDVDLEDAVHQLAIDEDPSPQRHGAVGEPRSPGARHDRDPAPVRQLHDLRDLLGGGGQHDHVGDVLLPAVQREGRGDAGPVDARRDPGEDALGPDDLNQLVEDRVGERGRAHGEAASLNPADSATSSIRSIDGDRLRAPRAGLGQRALGPDAGAHQGVHVEARRPLHPAPADLRGQVGPLDAEPAARARAVGPLGDVVDVLEGQARDRPQDLARRRVDALALVEPAGVVVRDDAIDRDRQRQTALADHLGHQLDRQHDLEVELVPEVLGVVLGERDVVVGVDRDDALGPARAPVGDVVLGESARLLDVAHLGRRSAAAPLLAHEAELDPAGLQDAGDRAGQRGAVEGGLAVAEEHGLAAHRQVEPGRPVGHPRLVDRRSVPHRLVPPIVGELVPGPPGGLVDAGVDGEGPHRLDQIHGAGAEAVEVPGEEGVRAAQLAGPALGAVDVVAGDVLHPEHALLHSDHVRVEGGRGVGLVAGDLHDRADLAAELVTRAEAVVRGGPPAVDEPLGQAPVGRLLLRRSLVHGASSPRERVVRANINEGTSRC